MSNTYLYDSPDIHDVLVTKLVLQLVEPAEELSDGPGVFLVLLRATSLLCVGLQLAQSAPQSRAVSLGVAQSQGRDTLVTRVWSYEL